MSVLVSGGAGYIGAHFVRVLCEAGQKVVVLDDLSTGHADAVDPRATFVRGEIDDVALVREVCKVHAVESAALFAGKIQVGESVREPRAYVRTNVVAAVAFVDALLDAGVRRLVFSSTAAVYGDPERLPLDEAHPKAPVNAYGATKLAVELVLEAYARAYDFGYVALRYFNAAGGDPAVPALAERHDPETHLVPLVLDAALGRRPSVAVFGTDWPTPDGTCLRDYIHVLDLAEAHVRALAYLAEGGASCALNLGTGKGVSVRDVLAAVEAELGVRVEVVEAPRRAGDPAELVADPSRAAEVLGFRTSRSDLRRIVADAAAHRRAFFGGGAG